MTIIWNPGPAPYSPCTVRAKDNRFGDFGGMLPDPAYPHDEICKSFDAYLAGQMTAHPDARHPELMSRVMELVEPAKALARDNTELTHITQFTLTMDNGTITKFSRTRNVSDSLRPTERRDTVNGPAVKLAPPTNPETDKTETDPALKDTNKTETDPALKDTNPDLTKVVDDPKSPTP